MTTKALKKIAKTKWHVINGINTTIHYTKEIKQQARVFRANFNRINKYENNNTTRLW